MPNGIVDSLVPLAVPLDSLVPFEGNPRVGDVEAIARSYAAFGQRKPLVARRAEDGRLVLEAGHHQVAAARSLGWDAVAVVVVEETEEAARAFALADNRTSDLGHSDEAGLLGLLSGLAETGREDLLLAASYSTSEYDDLLAATDDVVVLPPGKTDAHYAENDPGPTADTAQTHEEQGLWGVSLIFKEDQWSEYEGALRLLGKLWGLDSPKLVVLRALEEACS